MKGNHPDIEKALRPDLVGGLRTVPRKSGSTFGRNRQLAHLLYFADEATFWNEAAVERIPSV
jgi:hypothetical protein